MTFQVSPGVNVSEIDNTTSVPAVSTSTGAFVGNFRWGPVEQITVVSSENDLARKFSTPNKTNAVSFLHAAQFLSYSQDLRVVRQVTAAAKTANAGGAADTLVKNKTDYDSQSFAFANEGLFLARYPGELGNSLKVSLFGFKTDADTTETNFDNWDWSSRFDGPVGTSAHAAKNGSSNDEIHIAIIDEDGLFTGNPGTVLETFEYLSQAPDVRKSDGSTLYFVDVINEQSKYVYFADFDSTNMPNSGSATTGSLSYALTPASGIIDNSFTGGVDSGSLTASEYATGWDIFEDADTVDVSLLIAPDLPVSAEVTVVNDLISIVEARKDAVVFASPGSAMNTASAIKTFVDGVSSSSYVFIDSGRIQVYDKYNDQYVNLPANASVAGCAAATDREFGPWWSFAGGRRGQIRNVTKLFYNPSKTDRDILYKSRVNPIVSFPGEGTLLYGDRTGLSRPSAFGSVNVRRLFITLEKAISTASRATLFEFNDQFTRAQFINLVEPFLRTVQGRRGITDFKVVCNETNNPGDVVDRQEFVGDIYIKPARSINFVQLNFIATRTGVEFTEIAGE